MPAKTNWGVRGRTATLDPWLRQLRTRLVSVASRRVPREAVEDLVQDALAVILTRGIRGGSFGTVDGLPPLVWCLQVADGEDRPSAFRLYRPSPDPFRYVTTVRYELPRPSHVDLSVFDVTGRRIRGLEQGNFPAGKFDARWDGRAEDGRPAGSGVYFIRLEGPGPSLKTKLVKLQ